MASQCLTLLSKILVLEILVANLLPDLVDAFVMPPELSFKVLPLLLTLCQKMLRISQRLPQLSYLPLCNLVHLVSRILLDRLLNGLPTEARCFF
jgi:hypothetical protein